MKDYKGPNEKPFEPNWVAISAVLAISLAITILSVLKNHYG